LRAIKPKGQDVQKDNIIYLFFIGKFVIPRVLIWLFRGFESQSAYSTIGWLDKNKDPINETVVELLTHSKEHLVATLFAPPAVPGKGELTFQ
jgi:hypothetical protein